MPVIFLTSKDEEVDELLGLKLGADDYVKKSGGFSINVLIERVKVQFRKKDQVTPDSKNIIKQGKLMLDPEACAKTVSILANVASEANTCDPAET